MVTAIQRKRQVEKEPNMIDCRKRIKQGVMRSRLTMKEMKSTESEVNHA